MACIPALMRTSTCFFKNKIPVGFSRGRVKVLLSIDTKETDMSGLPDMSARVG